MDKAKKPVNKPGQRTISGKSRAQQHHKDEVNINTIVKRYLPSGSLPSHGKQPMYGDFTSIDYMSMLNAVSDIDSTFRQLPARVRGQFRNDPYQLLRFVENPQNEKEARRLGLLLDPTRPFGAQSDTEEGAPLETQSDLMNQAEIMDAIDPESIHFKKEVLADLQAAAQGGDQEAQLLIDSQAARMAARKAQRGQARQTVGPLKRKPSSPPEGGQ